LIRLVGWRALLLAIGAAVVADVAGIALTGTATWLLVRAAQRPELAALALGIAGVRAAALARGVARYGERLSGHDAALGALANLRDRVYRSLAAHVRPRSTDALGVVVQDVDAVQDLVVRCVLPFAGACVVSGVSIAAVWLLAPSAGPVLAAGLVVAGAGVPLVAGLLSRRSDRLVAGERAALTVSVVDLFGGAAELSVAGATARARSDVDDAAGRLAARQRSTPAHGATAVVLVIAGVTAVGGFLGAGGSGITAAVVLLVSLAAFDVCLPLPAAARQFARIRGVVPRLRDLADRAPAQARADVEAGPPEVVLTGVTVCYDTPALRDVDLRLPPGRRVAVVGATGSGKSTLLAAIARFATPTSGALTLGGRALDEWPERRLRETVGGVLADGHVFHDTIAANLRIGKPSATDDELAAVARRTRLLDWIIALPDGWQTVLGEDAVFASGGQRQRLLLARALLADPPVLLLDEPTDGLDPETADAVLADILATGRTVVLVTHRLTGLSAFDEVLLLDGGHVRQRGTHAELAGRPGPYRDLWRVRELVA
jgi:ATP-binding cassette subfamily C protein/ATP-binding cassette subfamily C protein CydC/ATP-binding cassette subfamily C protein CydCD